MCRRAGECDCVALVSRHLEAGIIVKIAGFCTGNVGIAKNENVNQCSSNDNTHRYHRTEIRLSEKKSLISQRKVEKLCTVEGRRDIETTGEYVLRNVVTTDMWGE